MSTVNQTELADILGVTTMTLLDWQKKGMPYLSREINGGANEYDTAACIKWYVNREIEKNKIESPRDRLDKIRGDREELELRIRLKQVADITTIQPAIDEFFTDLTGELDGMANRYIDAMLAAKNDRTDSYQVFRRIAREIRERLSGFDFRASVTAYEHSETETET